MSPWKLINESLTNFLNKNRIGESLDKKLAKHRQTVAEIQQQRNLERRSGPITPKTEKRYLKSLGKVAKTVEKINNRKTPT